MWKQVVKVYSRVGLAQVMRDMRQRMNAMSMTHSKRTLFCTVVCIIFFDKFRLVHRYLDEGLVLLDLGIPDWDPRHELEIDAGLIRSISSRTAAASW